MKALLLGLGMILMAVLTIILYQRQLGAIAFFGIAIVCFILSYRQFKGKS